MMNFKHAALGAALLASAAIPALAQTSPAQGNATTAPATHDLRPTTAMPTTTMPATKMPLGKTASTPSERNAALTDAGEVRASKVVGSSVYNGSNEKVGIIDDIVLGRDNKASMAILSVGGFLGMGKHYVAVPYTDLKLGDTKDASSHNKVVLPTATKDALKGMAEYHYSAS